MTSNRTIRVFLCLLAAVPVLLLSACQVATPASRIEQNPLLFASLPEADRVLVQQGQIRTGMSPNAVFLAWGYPNTQPFLGEKGGKRIERWVYTRPEPVMVTPGWDEPCWGTDGLLHYHGHMGMDTAYVPRNTAEVVFEDGKVVSWESRP